MPDAADPPADRASDDAGPPAVRASDVDREALVARLQKAMAEGRLNLDEFGQRAGAAYAAVTTSELAGLVADLPAEIVGGDRRQPGPGGADQRLR